MATRTRRRRNARRKTSQRRGKSGRFVKTKRSRRARAANPTKRRRRRARASNPTKRRRRRRARNASPVRRRRRARARNAAPRRRRRRRNTSSALTASVSDGKPRATNRRRRRSRRRRNTSTALAASVSSGPRAMNRRRRRNGMRRRRNAVATVTRSFGEIFSPRNIGAMLVGSSVRGAAGGASMTALSALLGLLPDQAAARKPVVVLPAILGVAAIGKWLEGTKMVSRMASRYFDPEDISRGIADQFRDVLYLTIAGAMGPGAAQVLGVFSPAVASQLALAAPAAASGILVQTTAGGFRQRRTRGIVAQSAPMATAGLSTMSDERSVYDDPDMG